ncbi:MAG TPA: response regulator, partial [Bradyrhizobium sp.]
MSRSQLVAEHLPLLRRYARALTGSQQSGDAYVAAMLEALLQDPSLLDEQYGARAGLFRLFTRIWNSVALNDNADVATLPMPPERRLSNITPLPRQAFLLLSLEGFPEQEVAYILGVDIPETRRLADTAGREMAAEIATDVLIIEDDTFIAMELETLVEGLGHRVLGVARTHAEALALTKRKRPGLILADIQLADGSSGLEAVNELLASFEAPVIFITAYP